jgi:hypothetical protein
MADADNLLEQLKKAKEEGKVGEGKKKSKFIRKKTEGEKINELLKKAAYGDNKMAKGGRAGFKAGSKGCKLAKRGRGRAYGKNS